MNTENTNLLVMRVFTRGIDRFNILIGEMDLESINMRTAGWAYCTLVEGEFFAANTGNELLRAINEEDDLIRVQLQHSRPVKEFLRALFELYSDEYEAQFTSATISREHLCLIAEKFPTWDTARKYFDDIYDHGQLWTYLNDYEFVPGDFFDILACDNDIDELIDRSEAYESDRLLALTRLAKHYFATAMRMISLNAEEQDVASAFAGFSNYYDRLVSE